MGRIVRCSVGCRWVLAVGLGWCLLSLAGAPAHAEPAEQVSEVAPAATVGKLRILLLGDSTIEGSIPRRLKPEGPHVEQVIEQLLAAEGDLPPCEVINVGLSGEYIERLMTSGRYDRVAAPLKDIDYIFVRYGINDRARVENFSERFPQQYHDLIARLRQDHPGAAIIPSSIIPFANEAASEQVNALIRQVAEREALPLFDIYPAYAEALRVHGHNALNYRRYALDRVPEKYHALVQPFVHGGQVMVMGHELDAILGHLPGWYGDRHPNLAGYNVIAVETVKYLSARIRVDRGEGGRSESAK